MNLSSPPTIEQGVNALVSDTKQKVTDTYQDCEDRVRESPGKAILIALAAGYCLHRLPIRSLLVAQVRLAAALAPPALFVFGAAKVCEFLQREAISRRDRQAVLAASRPFESP
jgi:hypothetical protein